MNKMISYKKKRRYFLKISSFAAIGLVFGCAVPVTLNSSKRRSRYKVAVSDWMILRRQKLSAFDLAEEIHADGLEMDMGGLGARDTFDSKLGNVETQKEFLEKSKETGIQISSIAMSGFYAQSFAKRSTVNIMVQDTIDTMKAMKVENAFLPLGVQGDMVKEPELRPLIVKRLKWAGKQVGKIGGVIAVETSFSGSDELKFLKEIDSKHVKSSFNFANAIKHKRDITDELKILGSKNIAQIHCSNTDGEWIENDPELDMPKIKKTLDKMGWSGWLIIERSRDTEIVHDVKANYGANVAYLKKIFQEI